MTPRTFQSTRHSRASRVEKAGRIEEKPPSCQPFLLRRRQSFLQTCHAAWRMPARWGDRRCACAAANKDPSRSGLGLGVSRRMLREGGTGMPWAAYRATAKPRLAHDMGSSGLLSFHNMVKSRERRDVSAYITRQRNSMLTSGRRANSWKSKSKSSALAPL